ncbi:hypothetical protein AB5J62_20810 [Amycolatopsis sp. cg5]
MSSVQTRPVTTTPVFSSPGTWPVSATSRISGPAHTTSRPSAVQNGCSK